MTLISKIVFIERKEQRLRKQTRKIERIYNIAGLPVFIAVLALIFGMFMFYMDVLSTFDQDIFSILGISMSVFSIAVIWFGIDIISNFYDKHIINLTKLSKMLKRKHEKLENIKTDKNELLKKITDIDFIEVKERSDINKDLKYLIVDSYEKNNFKDSTYDIFLDVFEERIKKATSNEAEGMKDLKKAFEAKMKKEKMDNVELRVENIVLKIEEEKQNFNGIETY